MALTQPGDADRVKILGAELQKTQQELQQLQSLPAPADPAQHKMYADNITRKSADVAALTRELGNAQGQKSYPMQAPAGQAPQQRSAPQAAAAPARVQTQDLSGLMSGTNPAKEATRLILTEAQTHDSNVAEQQAALAAARDTQYAGGMQAADLAGRKAANSAQIQQQSGLNPNDPANAYATIMSAMTDTSRAYEVERAKYDQLAGKDFFSDPLGFIMSRFEIGSQAGKVNQLAGQQARMKQELNDRLSLNQAGQAQMVLHDSTTAYEIESNKALQAKQEADARIAQLGAVGAMSKMQVIASLSNQAERANESPTIEALRKEQLAKAESMRIQREAEAARDAQVAGSLGLATAPDAKLMNDLPPNLQNELAASKVTGKVTPGLVAKLGKNLAMGPKALMYTTAQQIVAGQEAYAEQLKTQANTGPNADKYKSAAGQQALAEDAKMVYLEEMKSQVTNPKSSAKGALAVERDAGFNPFKLPTADWNRYLAQRAASGQPVPELQNNFMVQAVNGLLQDPAAKVAGKDSMRGEIEANAVAVLPEWIAMGKLKTPDGKAAPTQAIAAQIVQYYREGIKWNSARSGLEEMGVPVPEQYRAQLPMPSFAPGLPGWLQRSQTVNVNLTSQAEVQKYVDEYVKVRKLQAQYDTIQSNFK